MKIASFGIRELAERAKKSGAHDLAQGVINAAPPSSLIQVVKNLPFERFSTYNNRRGVPEYRNAIAAYLQNRGWQAYFENILATSGVTGGITAALLTECRPGDTVLLPEPFFIGHKLLLEVLGFKIEFYPLPIDTSPDWADIEKRFAHVKAAILTIPANPTGQFADPAMLQNLTEAAASSHCLLLIDEMYREFIWGEPSPDDDTYNSMNFGNTVVLRSFSKTFAIPGWRTGFAMTNSERIERMAPTHDALYLGGSTIAQHALAEALTSHLPDLNQYVSDLRASLLRNKEKLEAAFRDYGMEPLPVPATYYMLIKHNRSSDIAAMEELIEKKIVVTPLNILYSDTFQDTGYIRIHFAVSEETADRVSEILTQ